MSILLVGGEDIDFESSHGWGSSDTHENTTAGTFRSDYARCSLAVAYGSNATFTVPSGTYSRTTLGVCFQLHNNTFNVSAGGYVVDSLDMYGPTGTIRIAVYFNDKIYVATMGAGGPVNLPGNPPQPPAGLTRVDFNVVYSSTGSIELRYNDVLVWSYYGDITRDGETALGGKMAFGSWWVPPGGATYSYSEIVIIDGDSRSIKGVKTRVPTSNGNTHNWDTGTAADAASLNQATAQASPQLSSASGQINEYTTSPAVPMGVSILGVVVKAQALNGTSGPSNLNLVIRTGGIDYYSPDIPLGPSFSTVSYIWYNNPGTSSPWEPSQLPSDSSTFNIGIKSAT